MAADGTTVGPARAFTQVALYTTAAMEAAMCAVWCQPLGDRAGTSSTAATDRRSGSTTQSPGSKPGAFCAIRVSHSEIGSPRVSVCLHRFGLCTAKILKQFAVSRLDFISLNSGKSLELLMSDQVTRSSLDIDAAASRLICEAIGERLRSDAGPEDSDLPPRLQLLLGEMRQQDGDG